jgi:hypothetical protein
MIGRRLAATTVLIVAFYAGLGLAVLAPEAVYSGDIGVKYVQAQALVAHRFTSLDIPYPGAFLDPERAFLALRPPFVLTTAGETQAIFPPVSAVLQAVAVAAAGFRGMIVLSIVSSAAILIAACALAPRPHRLAVAIAVGVGSPIWFYAVSGWEHAPAVACGTAAFAWAVRARGASARVGFVAGVLVGAGAALRDEVMLLAPGLMLIAWLRGRHWRAPAAVVAGLLAPLLLSAAIEVWWFNRPAAAHLRHAVHLLQTALHLTSAPNPDVPVLRPMTPRERYDTVVTYWLFGRGTDPQVAAFAIGLALALAVRWRWRSSAGLLIWLLAFGATTAGDVWEVVTAPKWLAGLVRVAPYVVCALLPLAAGRRPDRAPLDPLDRLLPAAMLFTAVAYLAIAYAGVDTSGGKSLGPRLLLPLLPLLAVPATMVIASHLGSPAALDRATGAAGAALVAAAVVIHLGGTVPAYVQRNADDASAVLAAAAAPERIVVADDMYTAQLLFPLYDRKIVLLADTTALARRLGTLLAEQRVTGALLVSRNPEPAASLAPLRIARTDQRGRMVVQTWTR